MSDDHDDHDDLLLIAYLAGAHDARVQRDEARRKLAYIGKVCRQLASAGRGTQTRRQLSELADDILAFLQEQDHDG